MLTTEGLRLRPQATLDAVCRFLSLPRINVTAFPMPPEAAVARLLESVYPQFGPRTGWRLDGDYDPLAEPLRARLAGFFEPYNRALFEYLGPDAARALREDWSV